MRTSATFRFRLPDDSPAKIEIFDTSGGRVASLRPREASAGWHVASWSGRTERGDLAKPGVYFARLAAGTQVVAKRLVLLPR